MIKIAHAKIDSLSPSQIKEPTEIFKRLSEKGLLIKLKRGKYKLYHPLFKDYLKNPIKDKRINYYL